MSMLKWLARVTGRTQDEAMSLGDTQATHAMRLLYGAILLGLLAIFVPHFVAKFGRWQAFRVDAPLSSTLWRELDATGAPCPDDARAAPGCAARPGHGPLWTSPLSRDAGRLARRDSESRAPFWIGVEIPVALLEQAHARRANQLLLGWIVSSHRIWIDGHLELSGRGERNQRPIVLPIPRDRLTQNRPLSVAILVYRDTEWAVPDHLNDAQGGGATSGAKSGVGFVTAENGAAFQDFAMFWDTVRPFALLIAYLVVASFFFSVWMRSQAKPEFFYIALFALTSAFCQGRMTSLFSSAVSHEATTGLDVVLRLWIAGFGMAMGFAFARVRITYFKWGVPLLIGLPFAILLLLPTSHARHQLIPLLRDWAPPAAYIFGAAACFLQAYSLLASRRPRAGRVRRLALFGAALALVGVFQVLQGNDLVPSIARSIWMGLGFEHFAFVVLLGSIALAEANPASGSRASRLRPVLPPNVSGAALLMRIEAPVPLESLVASHAFTTVARYGGTLVDLGEHRLLAFFDCEAAADPLRSARETFHDLAADVLVLSDRHGGAIRLRGGLAHTDESDALGAAEARLAAAARAAESIALGERKADKPRRKAAA